MNDYQVVIIGAGMSGICAAYKLLEAGFDSFRILDKSNEPGGTWRDNTYPGVACDVPSHLYSFSFAPKPDWTRMYAPGGEIRDYLEQCIRRFGIGPYLDIGVKVEEIEFQQGRWNIRTASGADYTADFVISGMGGLHTPNVADLPGLGDFQGTCFHTSGWPGQLELEGRTVGVIGTGATAVQLIPEIAEQTDRLLVFQRSACWVLPKKDPLYTETEVAEFRADPRSIVTHRKAIWQEWEEFSVEVVRPTERNAYLQDLVSRRIREVVEDPHVAEQLTPDYRYGCKRPTLSNRYYPAFNRSNVELITSAIERIESTGVRTADGAFHEVDVLVLATGFKAFDITAEVSIRGVGGVTLEEAWKERIGAYLSVMVPRFPNFFVLLGPNSAGLTSALEMIEAQCDFVVRALRFLNAQGEQHLAPTETALQEWVELIARGLSGTVMNEGCSSWWTDEKGYSHALWPYSSVKFRDLLSRIDPDSFMVGTEP